MRRTSLMRRALGLCGSGLVLVGAALASGSPASDERKVPLEEMAKSYREAHCKKLPEGEECNFESIVQRDFVAVAIGTIRIEYPVAFLADKKCAEMYREILVGITDLHSTWIDWFATPSDATTAAKSDIGLLRAWMSGLKVPQLAALAKSSPRDLYAALEADNALIDANLRLTAFLSSPDNLSLVPSEPKGLRLFLAPTRLEFLHLLGLTGSEMEAVRKENWVDGVDQWTQFWIGWTSMVLALEYAPWEGFDPKFKSSQPMAKVGATVLIQHVVQQTTLVLLHNCQPYARENHFDKSIALNMAIAICGEVATIENAGVVGTSGAATAPYERFVPGGNSSGGTLPPQEAEGFDTIVENHWRKGRGKDFFLAPLREGQKNGFKELKDASKDPLAFFLLKATDAGGKHLMHAPFFGPFAKEQSYPPAQFIIDFSEFYRSYKTAFCHWLMSYGDPTSSAASFTKFRDLARALGRRESDLPIDEFVTAAYGVPLSGKDGSTDSLEWRFLKWIAEGK